MTDRMLPGRPYPLGATWDGHGVNFAIFSENATSVELCLFDPDDPKRETARHVLPERTDQVWHGFLPGLEPGQLYGYRLHGPYDPPAGHRFNPNKLLIDPYAKAIAGDVDWSVPVFGYRRDARDAFLPDQRDSAHGVPRNVVIDPRFDWGDDLAPRIPLEESIIYETHVRGFSLQNSKVPPELRGTFAGLGHSASIEYLTNLGITAVELLPVHDMLDDQRLSQKGLRNYWGYNTTNFFSPAARYAASGDRGGQVREFKEMVRALHRAGIEVILDVVYNHTSETHGYGPTLSFRGIDNAVYYLLDPEDPARYLNYTGTGNTINASHPQVLQLIMDSLRYWIQEMHVDGFRFDLAPVLAREDHAFSLGAAFFDIIHQDPVISQVKLIAEPWDLGEGGYQLGNFPLRWSEWNGKYRDTVRRFWRGDERQTAELAYRLTGSSDLYRDDGRMPTSSINLVTAHDGFTLHDLVTYQHKYNHANGERNRDGSNHSFSWNSGVEGETNDPDVLELRERRKRTFLATLLWSQGVPMLLGGDEIGRTQQGNNNAYAQDNEVSWYDWKLSEREESLLQFTQRLIALRRRHPVLKRRSFLDGKPVGDANAPDATWLRPDGSQMTGADWTRADLHTLGLRLAGDAQGERDEFGTPRDDDTLLILLNADRRSVRFTLPRNHRGIGWQIEIDSGRPESGADVEGERFHAGDGVHLIGYSAVLLKQIEPPH